MFLKNTEELNIKAKQGNNNLCETFYCDSSHPLINEKSNKFKTNFSGVELINKFFLYVRDSVIFGGDHWKVKASDTLLKGYGSCFNKNVLLVALLRSSGIEAKLMANPLKKSFTKPSVGFAHIFFSNPFHHCFTKVKTEYGWVSVDPTLDRKTYETFFKPSGVTWGIDWDGKDDMQLYTESLAGPAVEYKDIDKALNRNLDSYFLFKYEPEILRSIWLKIGNMNMWRKKGI